MTTNPFPAEPTTTSTAATGDAASTRIAVIVPALTAGALMALYLVLRPYGDTGDEMQAYAAFASPLWVMSHLAGMAGLSAAAWWAARASRLGRGLVARVARSAGPVGLVGILPYYGAEAFALQVIGRQRLAGQDVSGLVASVREHAVGMPLFGVGLLLLAAAGLTAARCWQQATRQQGRRSWAAWPLGVMVATVLPQYYLPVPGRIAFGLVFLAAAALMAAGARGRTSHAAPTT